MVDAKILLGKILQRFQDRSVSQVAGKKALAMSEKQTNLSLLPGRLVKTRPYLLAK